MQVSAAPVPEYTVIDLGTLGGRWSEAHGINDHGQVVGYSRTQSERKHAFLYSDGTMQDLGTLEGESSSYARGINNKGEVVGYSETRVGDDGRAFFYSNGIMKDLSVLVGRNSYAYGINNHGQVVGDFSTQSGDNRTFLYSSSNGFVKDLGTLGGRWSTVHGINDNGQVVGDFSTPSGDERAFLYSPDGSVKDLGTLGGISTARGINNKAEVVGYYVPQPRNVRAFLYSNGVMQDISTFVERDSYAYGINNLGQVVGAIGWWGDWGREGLAFLYSNGVMMNLNDLINKDSGWWLYEATAVNNRGQIVGRGRNPSGKGHAFLLNPIASSWRKVIETQPIQPTYSEPPKKENVKDSLVVVTHGWRPDIKWLDEMTNAITTYLIANGLQSWQVHAHKWEEKARTSLLNVLGSAEREGENLGQRLATNNWRHIHLIAHSAGSALIQAATDTVKEKSPTTIVHLTFLDAYNGIIYGGKNKYGIGADWVDSHFSRDQETVLTDKIIPNAYNVDVTWLDTNKQSIQMYASTPLGEISKTCYQTVTSHGWPYQFYTATVPPNTVLGSEGFGFPLSKEGGNWSFATNMYKVVANMLQVLGSGELSCTPNPSRTQLQVELPRDFGKLPGASVIINAPEKVNIRGIDFTLKTASPAWLAATLPITNRVNLVSFEAAFISTSGAEGLLSVYWETNIISSVDERVALSGMRQYQFPIPETVSSGTRTLGFRLDAFSAIQSSVTVTNVALGFAGVREPFSLSFIGSDANRLPILQLNGPSGYNYSVETSINLTDWKTIAILVNTNGTVRFVDPNTNNATARFYRAVAP